jgi:hypothetical protein
VELVEQEEAVEELMEVVLQPLPVVKEDLVLIQDKLVELNHQMELMLLVEEQQAEVMVEQTLVAAAVVVGTILTHLVAVQVVPVSSSSLILLDILHKTLYNIQVFHILVSLGLKVPLQWCEEVSWWLQRRVLYPPFFSYKLL